MAATPERERERVGRSSVEEDIGRSQVRVALLFGAILTVIGLAGPIFGGGPRGELLVFGRNYLHDALHLLTGLGGLVAGYYANGVLSDEYNKYGGLAYVLLFGLGLVFFNVLADIINLNQADNFLHLFLGLALAGVGFGLRDRDYDGD